MKQCEYEICNYVSPDDPSWIEWKNSIKAEGWINCGDESSLAILPSFSSTKVVLARNKADGNFIGSVVWNENDNMAYIGYYIVQPMYRGLGIGSLMWKQALQRIPQSYTIPLRAVEYMASRYKKTDTPIEGPIIKSQRIRVQDLMDIAKPRLLTHLSTKLVSTLSPEEYQAMLDYDADITGRNRSELIRQHFDLNFTEGAVALGKDNDVIAFASVTPTGTPNSHLYKMAPIYAQGLAEAFTAIYPLFKEIEAKDADAIIVINTWSSSVGEQLLWPLIEKKSIFSKTGAYVLFSKPYKNPTDFSRLFAGHSHSAHWEA